MWPVAIRRPSLPREVVAGVIVANDTMCAALSQRRDWAVVHACKEPCHRRAVGYVGRNPTVRDVDFWAARRGQHLYLNLVDAPDVSYIETAAIEAALAFLSEQAANGLEVAVHCNQGRSRAPSIALLHLVRSGMLPREYAAALIEFRQRYPAYQPGAGMAEWVRRNWDRVSREG